MAGLSALRQAIHATAARVKAAEDSELGEELIDIREGIDLLEAIFAEGLHRFDRSAEYRADGALSSVAWLRWKCRLSGGAAAERVGIARQLPHLPKTGEAFFRGAVGYQHVATLARTAANVGAAPLREHEGTLLQAARTMDPGQFVNVAKDFEQRVDAESVLHEANRAYARRYLHVSEPVNGLVRLDGLLDAEGGAIMRTALDAVMTPNRDDERTTGQKRADALTDLCRRQLDGGKLPDVGGQRPHLTITTTIDTLAGLSGQPSIDLQGAGSVPAETVRRLACDTAVTRITGKAGGAAASTGEREMRAEVSRASRTIPSATLRALVARDHGCVFAGCGRPPAWTDAHHMRLWIDGGPTTLENLALLCRRHHRMVHEGGWKLERQPDGIWNAHPVNARRHPQARSA